MRRSQDVRSSILMVCVVASLLACLGLSCGCARPATTPARLSSPESTSTARPDDIVIVRDDQVWRVHLDGTGAVQLTSEEPSMTAAEFSPDHKSVVYVTRDWLKRTSLGIIPASGGRPRVWNYERLTHATFSPDSTRVAYVQTDWDSHRHALRERVSVLSPASGESTKVLEFWGRWVTDLCWSPDGTRLLLCTVPDRGRMTLKVDALTLTTHKVVSLKAPDALYARTSPDGETLVLTQWTRDHSAVSVAAADGTVRRVLVSRPSPRGLWSGLLSDAAFSSDGKWVVYVDDGAVFAVRPDGTAAHRVVSLESTTSATASW